MGSVQVRVDFVTLNTMCVYTHDKTYSPFRSIDRLESVSNVFEKHSIECLNTRPVVHFYFRIYSRC